jgi:hypothetical protein
MKVATGYETSPRSSANIGSEGNDYRHHHTDIETKDYTSHSSEFTVFSKAASTPWHDIGKHHDVHTQTRPIKSLLFNTTSNNSLLRDKRLIYLAVNDCVLVQTEST